MLVFVGCGSGGGIGLVFVGCGSGGGIGLVVFVGDSAFAVVCGDRG